MELWDAYYADGSLAGRDLIRGEPIPEGCITLLPKLPYGMPTALFS